MSLRSFRGTLVPATLGFVFALLTTGCGGEDDEGPRCDVADDITFAQVQPLFDTHCTRCHATTRSGSDRNGAPQNRNFDTFEAASASAVAALSAIEGRRMPPNNPSAVSAQEICLLAAWIDQGLQP